MSLTAETIEAIRQRIDIVKLVGSRVTLKKRGTDWVGCCPFHDEKTPSFSVSQEKGLYYCFGCHVGGDVFSFVMRHEGVDFRTAADQLGRTAGIPLEPEAPEARERRLEAERLAETNALAHSFFVGALWAGEGASARRYLRDRSLPDSMSRQWRLGYGGRPGELLRYLDGQKISRAIAARAGITTEDGNRSLFDDRVVFPIYDPLGRLAGFGARRLGEGTSPKYINTRGGPLFSKRKLLYGWQEAQTGIRRSRRVVVVEGYMDVLAAHRAGVPEAVAALGTAFTEDHARTCARLANEAVLLLDADAAGHLAAHGAAELMLQSGLKTLVATLPAGEDPDSLARKQGGAALAQQVSGARPAIEHFIEQALGHEDLTVEDRARAAQQIAPLLAALTSGLERDLYTARLAERVGVSVEQLNRHLEASCAKRARPRAPESTAAQPPPRAAPSPDPHPEGPDAQELEVLRELLLYPELRPRFGELAEYARTPQMQVLLDALAHGDTCTAELIGEHVPDRRWVERLCRITPACASEDLSADETAERTFADILQRLKARHVQAALRDILRQMAHAEAQHEDLTELLRRKQDLTRRKAELRRADPSRKPPDEIATCTRVAAGGAVEVGRESEIGRKVEVGRKVELDGSVWASADAPDRTRDVF